MHYTILFLTTVLPVLVVIALVKVRWHTTITWVESGLTLLVSLICSAIIIGFGMYSNVQDVEIWNGEILDKERIHGSYQESYQCQCSTDSKGNTRCQTCWRTVYTVDWNVKSTIGLIRVDRDTSYNRSVYNNANPRVWAEANTADPVSIKRSFINYVKGAPDSLFHATALVNWKDKLPSYPSAIYDVFKIDRLVQVGTNLSDAAQWNKDISMVLRKLGPEKQANVIVVTTSHTDRTFVEALRAHWLGGKKNDVIVVLSVNGDQTINWTDVISWTNSEIFKIKLRDALMDLNTLDRTAVMGTIVEHVSGTFVRRNMDDFKYLEDKIEPPTWAYIMVVLTNIVIVVGGAFFFHRHDVLSISVKGRAQAARNIARYRR